jgi:hypothetical protein
MDQGSGKKQRSVKFYALAISVCAHVVGLSVFAAVKMSQTPAAPLQSAAVVSINQARQLAQEATVAPKPKVTTPLLGFDNRIIRKNNQPIITSQNPETIMQLSQPVIVQEQEVIKPQTEQPANIEQPVAQVGFFDNTTQGRRICYVVDCSGSMQGLWGHVKAELVESIGQLEQDQYFCIIVFGAGSILETNGGKMARSTEKTKNETYGFINSLNPAGSTNALAALQQAVKVRDATGQPPDVIYFLTDGFELSEQDGSRFAHQVITMLRSFAPKTQINTIGLWPAETDKRTLETIANQSGGRFTLIVETDEKNK